MSEPLVSVVMAVYNGAKYLRPTLKSLLNQTFKDFELVIVNDASSDATLEVIRSFTDPRIRIHNNPNNLGQTKSLNIGLKLAEGKYIARTDAGDISLPKRLQEQVKYMLKHPEVAVLGTAALQYNEKGQIINVVYMPNTRRGILQRIFFTTPLVHISVLMEKSVILKIGSYDEDYAILADYELWSRLLMKNQVLANLPRVLAGYLVSNQSFGMSNAAGRSVLEAARIIQCNAKAFAGFELTQEETTSIFRVLNLDLGMLPLAEIVAAENLLKKIYNKLGELNYEGQYFIFKKYFKAVWFTPAARKDKAKFWYLCNSVIKNAGLQLLRGLIEGFKLWMHVLWWRLKRASVKADFYL
jgi:glycosyltransferase involved in cell wall biosynthesis